MSDLIKIARSRVAHEGRTHWEGCERDHHECLIQRLADELERSRAEVERKSRLIDDAEVVDGEIAEWNKR